MSRAGKPVRLNTVAYTDFGVRYVKHGRFRKTSPLVRVKRNPKRGQYIFNPKTGSYTFSLEDKGRHLAVSCSQLPA